MGEGAWFRKLGPIIVGTSVVVSCASFGMFSTGPDRSKWTPYTIQASDWTLTFEVPGGQQAEPWSHLWVRSVDLDRDKDLAVGRAAHVFKASWDYAAGFSDGLLGSIQLQVFVVPRLEGYTQNLLLAGDLETYRRTRDTQAWGPLNERNRLQKKEYLIVNVPQAYDRVRLHEREWVRFKFSGNLDHYGYVLGLREDRYVEVQFGFADNGKRREDWRLDAERLREEIAATLRLEKKPKSPL